MEGYLAVPVISRTGEVIGGLFFGHKDVGVFTAKDESAIAIMASQAAIAIDNARLFEARAHAETRAEAARAQAEDASRLKDEFLAVVSHELRTPLSAMVGWLRMLDAGLVDDERRAKALATISRNADALHQLVDDLLDVFPRDQRQDADRGPAARSRRRDSLVDRRGPPCRRGEADQADDGARPQRVRGDAWRRGPDPASGVEHRGSNAVKFTPRGGK